MTNLNQSLEQLKTDCQQQIDQYHQGKQDDGCLSCLEIVRRAAQDVASALNLLLEITTPLIYRKCPVQLAGYKEDIAQDVSFRLIQKFRHPTSPFRVSTFPAYRNYVNFIIRSVIHEIYEDQNMLLSVELLQEDRDFELTSQDTTQEVVYQDQAKLLLALLPNPLEREVFWRRHALGETSAEIVETLLPFYPDMTKQRVYRLLELAMRRLRKNPNLQDLR